VEEEGLANLLVWRRKGRLNLPCRRGEAGLSSSVEEDELANPPV
jgi:hypothetical protein